MTIANITAMSGMILDTLGAVILARTFCVKRPKEVFREVNSLGTWDFAMTVGARNLLVSWLVQSNEAKSGALILGIGFTLQAIAQVLPSLTAPFPLLILASVLIISMCIFFILQTIFVRSAALDGKKYYKAWEQDAKTPESWMPIIEKRLNELEEIRKFPKMWLTDGAPHS